VGPVVIRALDAIDEVAFGLVAQPRAAMAADVEQRLDRAGSVARDDDALVAERASEVVARFWNLIGAAGADPAIEVEAIERSVIAMPGRQAMRRATPGRKCDGTLDRAPTTSGTANISR